MEPVGLWLWLARIYSQFFWDLRSKPRIVAKCWQSSWREGSSLTSKGWNWEDLSRKIISSAQLCSWYRNRLIHWLSCASGRCEHRSTWDWRVLPRTGHTNCQKNGSNLHSLWMTISWWLQLRFPCSIHFWFRWSRTWQKFRGRVRCTLTVSRLFIRFCGILAQYPPTPCANWCCSTSRLRLLISNWPVLAYRAVLGLYRWGRQAPFWPKWGWFLLWQHPPPFCQLLWRNCSLFLLFSCSASCSSSPALFSTTFKVDRWCQIQPSWGCRLTIKAQSECSGY